MLFCAAKAADANAVVLTTFDAMKSIRSLFNTLFFAALLIHSGCNAQPQKSALPIAQPESVPSVSTVVYAEKSGEKLEADLYTPADSASNRAVVIFVHGGGFYTGTRKEDNIEHFCDSLSRAGYFAVNMSYRLYLKGQSFHCDQPNEEKIKAFATAVNDVRSLTQWLIDRADSLHIDPSRIFLSGSSAGAEAVLHAAYWSQSVYTEGPQLLENNFRFAGVCAFAGALIDTNLISSENAIPTLLYHGTDDPLVPYASAIHHYCPEDSPGGLPLHGSYSIFERMRQLNAPVRLVTRCGGKHGSAVTPIEDDIALILRFLRMAEREKSFAEHEIRHLGEDRERYGKWSHCD